MRFTLPLLRKALHKSHEYHYKKQFRYWIENQKIPVQELPPIVKQSLSSKGIKLEDPSKQEESLQTQWSNVDPREYFAIPDPRTHSDPALMFSLSEPFTEDIRQAAILTNTHVIKGVAPRISPLIQELKFGDEIDERIQQSILHAHIWKADEDDMPRRIHHISKIWKFKNNFGILPENSVRYLMGDLIRHCEYLFGPRYPKQMEDRRLVRDSFLETHYLWNQQRIHVELESPLAIWSRRSLPVFAAGTERSDATRFPGGGSGESGGDVDLLSPLPDIFPVAPTADLVHSKRYSLQHSPGLQLDRPQVWPFVHPHLLCINAAAIAPWNDSTPLDRRLDDDKRSAGALVLAFAQARAVAAARYGANVSGRLPEPVRVMALVCDGAQFDVVAYQLNTLEMDPPRDLPPAQPSVATEPPLPASVRERLLAQPTATPVSPATATPAATRVPPSTRNIAWCDAGNKLFNKRLPTKASLHRSRFEDYDPAVFRKIAASYLFGLLT